MRRLLVLLFATALLALPACGEGEGPGEALGIVQKAGAATRSAGTAKVHLSVRTPAGEGPEMITFKGDGIFDLDGQRGSLTMQVPEDIAAAGGPEEITMAFDGTTMFMKQPEGAPTMPGVDTPWVSFDFAALGEELTGTDLGQLAGAGNDPTQALTMLEGVSDEVEELGSDEVRGTPVTHYRATIDLRRAAEKSGAVTDPAQFERFVAHLGTDEMEVEVWVDRDGRVRRQQFEQPIPDDGRSVTVRIELDEFGTTDQPEIPDPDDVTDITDQVRREIEQREPVSG